MFPGILGPLHSIRSPAQSTMHSRSLHTDSLTKALTRCLTCAQVNLVGVDSILKNVNKLKQTYEITRCLILTTHTNLEFEAP